MRLKTTLNLNVREYLRDQGIEGTSSWSSLREIPTSEEINTSEDAQVWVNTIDGPWDGKDEYLRAHYSLLRDDAVGPLRDAVREIKASPKMMERHSREHAGIYENVCTADLSVSIYSNSTGLHYWFHVCCAWHCRKSCILDNASGEADQMGTVEAADKWKYGSTYSCQ